MTIDFYYVPGSGPCRAVQLMAKVLELTLNEKELDIMQKEQFTPQFLKINPQHSIPTVVDNGFVLWESGPILTYFAAKYSKDESLYPKDFKKRAMVDQRLCFNLGTLAARFGDYYYPLMFNPNVTANPQKYEKMNEAFQILDVFLEGQDYVAGNTLTVADIAIVTTVATYDVAKFDITEYKNVVRWYSKLQQSIPGYDEVNGKEILSKLFEIAVYVTSAERPSVQDW